MATQFEMPLVSVLTPSFNQGQWLRDNLMSVADQSYPRVEHIVVDGASTDDSVDVLRGAASEIRWVSEPDRGQSDAINKAFGLSGGEIIGWLNSDDAYFSSQAIERAVRIFARRPDVGVVFGHAVLVDGSGGVMQVMWAPPFSRGLLRTYNFIVQPTAFVRRAVLDGGQLVDERYEFMMDRELWLRLSERTRFARLDHIIAIDRHHDARKSYNRPDLAAADEAQLVATYGIQSGLRARAKAKAVKVALRYAGATKVGMAVRTAPELRHRSDGYARLMIRQVCMPRRFMEVAGR